LGHARAVLGYVRGSSSTFHIVQPHPPQLPMNDAAHTAGPTNWKRPALLLLGVVAVLLALTALLLPKKQVTGRNAPAPTEHRRQAPGYSHPTQ
jgi:hypothetical protein